MTTAVAICLCWIGAPPAQPDAAPNVWTKLERAQIVGQRWDVPVGYSPDLKRFLVLGGRTSWAEYKKPRPYDVLALNGGEWENWFPRG